MSYSYDQIKDEAQKFKEKVWAFLEMYPSGSVYDVPLMNKVNDVLDTIDELPFDE